MKRDALYLTLAPLLLFFAGCTAPHAPLITVSQVDLERYSGTWYEIARYENSFEEGCIGATATYTPDEGTVKVVNRCLNAQGTETERAKGEARIVEESGNAKLEVTFFWPFYGDYWILMLDGDYRYTVVGEPSRRYFWILARSPQLDSADKSKILQTMQSWGYDPQLLYWTSYPADLPQ